MSDASLFSVKNRLNWNVIKPAPKRKMTKKTLAKGEVMSVRNSLFVIVDTGFKFIFLNVS